MRVHRPLAVFVVLALSAGGAHAACRDYPDQASAQRAFVGEPVALRDLDRDRDGIACEDHRYPERDAARMGRGKAYWNTSNAYTLPAVPRYFTQWPRD